MGVSDKKLRLFGIPILAVIMSLFVGRDAWEMGGLNILWAVFKALIYTFTIWEGNCRIMKYLFTLYPDIQQTTRRILTEVLCVFLYTLVANWGVTVVIDFIVEGHLVDENQSLLLHVTSALFPTALLLCIYECMYFFNAWKANIERTEAIARTNVQTQFEALKKQLDPHFLFNCMNTLASLIDVENEEAQRYLARLSDVYRYVLDTREQATITIEEELRFLDAYIYLNEVRFRENLRVNRELDQGIYQHRLPSLSLQLLVENAIKHNIVSREHPLTIRIYKEGEFLVVENNKQLKKTLQRSTRLGLQNIVKRYKLLTEHPVHINESDHLFKVQIPILDPIVS